MCPRALEVCAKELVSDRRRSKATRTGIVALHARATPCHGDRGEQFRTNCGWHCRWCKQAGPPVKRFSSCRAGHQRLSAACVNRNHVDRAVRHGGNCIQRAHSNPPSSPRPCDDAATRRLVEERLSECKHRREPMRFKETMLPGWPASASMSGCNCALQPHFPTRPPMRHRQHPCCPAFQQVSPRKISFQAVHCLLPADLAASSARIVPPPSPSITSNPPDASAHAHKVSLSSRPTRTKLGRSERQKMIFPSVHPCLLRAGLPLEVADDGAGRHT